MAKKRLIGEADYIKQLEDDLINEDSDISLEGLKGMGFDMDVIQPVGVLTKDGKIFLNI